MPTQHVSPAGVQKFLAGIDYPCSKEDLVNHAQRQGADENVINMLQSLDDDKFETAADVSKAIGEIE